MISNRKIDGIVKEVVDNYIANQLLFEFYARDKSAYMELVQNMMEQIVQNWCLIVFCQKYWNDNQNINHWKSELSGIMRDIAKEDIKLKNCNTEKRKRAILQAITNIGYFDSEIIYKNICKKFTKEGIDAKAKETAEVSELFIENIEQISLLMASKDYEAIENYCSNL